jgi:hypothetical protein
LGSRVKLTKRLAIKEVWGPRMKKYLFLSLVLLSLILPWACSDNNNNPTKPPVSTLNPATYTPTLPPLFTSTPTLVPGTFTITPTITPTHYTAPAYVEEWPAASAPNGCSFDGGGNLWVAEYDGTLPYLEEFVPTAPNGNPTGGDLLPLCQGVTVSLVGPQGAVIANGQLCVLDNSSSTDTVYIQNMAVSQATEGTSWGTLPFNNAKGFCTDGYYIYVADTGNGWVDQFTPAELFAPGNIHRWKGNGTNNFKTPVAVACDAVSNVFVGDNGYTPAIIQEYSSGGVSFLGQWTISPNGPNKTVINGMALDPANRNHIYVSDLGNSLVVEYDITNLDTNVVPVMRTWSNPHGPRELQLFGPSCIALDDTDGLIIVGDQNNETLEVWTAP